MTNTPYDKALVPGGEWTVCPLTETNIYAPDHRGGTRRVLDVRGWSYLTGQGGGLGLPFDEAIKIQNAIGMFVCEAGTVLHETGMTPRELADEVKRLRAVNIEPLRQRALRAEAENERLRADMNDALNRHGVTDCHQILTAALRWKPNDKWCQCANNFVSSCVCTTYLATLAADPEAPMTLQPVAPAQDVNAELLEAIAALTLAETQWNENQDMPAFKALSAAIDKCKAAAAPKTEVT
jgi:hypothetical protein